MNDTEYGLTAGVYTRDERRAKRILAQVRCGVGVLELLRPREPAAAVVRRRALGHRASRCRPTASQTFTRPKAWHLRRT